MNDLDAAAILGWSFPSGERPATLLNRLKPTRRFLVGPLAPDGWSGLSFIADDSDIFAFRILALPSEWLAEWDAPDAQHESLVDRWTRNSTSWWIRPGPIAPDRSYACIDWKPPKGVELRSEWSITGRGGAVGKTASGNPATLLIQAWCPWSRCAGTLIDPHARGVPAHLNIYAPAPDARGLRGRSLQPGTLDGLRWCLRVDRQPDVFSDDGNMFVFALFRDVRELRWSAQQGQTYQSIETQAEDRLATIDQSLSAARDAYLAKRPVGSGALSAAPDAINDQLGWSVVYTPSRKREYVTVSRDWAVKNNSAPDFLWDSFFNGLLVSQEDPARGRETVRDILSWQREDGMLPQYGHWFDVHGLNGDPIAYGHTQYPGVAPLCIAKMHCRHPDPAFLNEVFDSLFRANRWWFSDRGDDQPWRDGNRNGLLELGANYPEELPLAKLHQRACFESHDDSPQWFDSGAKFNSQTGTLEIDTVERNCMWATDCWTLAWIARQIGRVREAELLEADHAAMADRINRLLWCEKRQCYMNRRWSPVDGDDFFPEMAPDIFLTLLAKVATPERGEQLRRIWHDKNKFAGQWLLPTVSRDDPAYPVQHYWRGKVWAPINYLVYQGLRIADWDNEADQLARSSLDMFIGPWRREGKCFENYLATTGEGASDPHYTWGALMALIGIEHVADANPWAGVELRPEKTASLGDRKISISRYPIGGQLVAVGDDIQSKA
jgi:hypothetical protein